MRLRGWLPATAVFLSLGCQAGLALDGLYFQLRHMFFGRNMSIEEVHWWFLPDGRYLNQVPDSGLTAAEFEANCPPTSQVCGTYKVSGQQLVLTPRSGASKTISLKPVADGNYEIDGLFALHVAKFPAGAKLDGQYAWEGGAGNSVTGISAAKMFIFRPDGTFSTETDASASTRSTVASSNSKNGGTYQVNGNTLIVSMGGKTTRHVIYPYDDGKKLHIDHGMFHKER